MRPRKNTIPRIAQLLAWAAMSVATIAHAQSPEENYGARVARRDCSQCHAVGFTGDSPNAKAPRFRELHKRFVAPDLQERLLEQLMLHHADMPKFRLSMEELSGLIAYLKLIQTDQLSYVTPAASETPKG
jgi:cytochrome c